MEQPLYKNGTTTLQKIYFAGAGVVCGEHRGLAILPGQSYKRLQCHVRLRRGLWGRQLATLGGRD